MRQPWLEFSCYAAALQNRHPGTDEENVLSNSSANMSDCNHEEADTRMIVYVEHSIVSGAKNIGICSQDTDVVIIVWHFSINYKQNTTLMI